MTDTAPESPAEPEELKAQESHTERDNSTEPEYPPLPLPMPSLPKSMNILDVKDDSPKGSNFPVKYMNSLLIKWKTLFNDIMKKHRDVRILNACMDTATFMNCNGVKFATTHFTYNRDQKEFDIHVQPMYQQDNMCFRHNPRRRGIFILVKSPKLKTLFLKFFEKINKIHFCVECGNFVYDTHFYPEHDICETCLFEEIACAQRKETQICSICLEPMKRWYKTHCGHYFHRRCLVGIDRNRIARCPNCRAALDPEDQQFLDEEGDEDEYIDDE